MSCKRTVRSFQPIEVKIDCIDKETVDEIEKSTVAAVCQKLEKLGGIFKNLCVYCAEDTLLVNDRFGVCKDFPEIAQAFGLEVRQIDCALKGRTYIVRDELVDMIRMLDPKFVLDKFANSQISSELKELVRKAVAQRSVDDELTSILRAIKKQGYYSVSGMQHVTTTYFDGRVLKQSIGEIVSDKERVVTELEWFAKSAKSALAKANDNLRDGTVKLLCSRARQMGYSVKEERNGEQVQLILVRVE